MNCINTFQTTKHSRSFRDTSQSSSKFPSDETRVLFLVTPQDPALKPHPLFSLSVAESPAEDSPSLQDPQEAPAGRQVDSPGTENICSFILLKVESESESEMKKSLTSENKTTD